MIYIIGSIIVLVGTAFLFYYFKPQKKERIESIYTKALNAMIRGDSRTALTHLRDVVKQDTDHIDAYLQMGNILRREENPLAAKKIHQSLMVRPNLSKQILLDIHMALALDFELLGDLAKAQNEAELILKIDKKNLWANEFLLTVFEKQKKWDKAAIVSKTVQRIKQHKNNQQVAKFLVFQGMDKIDKGQESEALSIFNKAVKIAPDYGLSYLRLGDYYSDKRDLTKAIENWEKFAIYDPKDSHKVYSKIESALFDLGRFSEVEKFYERILDNDPLNLTALAKLANVLEEKGDHRDALNLVDEALSKNDLSVHAHLMKLKLSLQVSKPHELSNYIDKIIQLLTTNKE